MDEDYRKRVAEILILSITPDNVAQIYKRNFTRYLFENSDEVEINGKVYGNSKEDRITRAFLMFPNEQGESNIQTASGCNTKGGFPLTEKHFIDNQLDILKDLVFTDFTKNEKYKTYLNFIQEKKSPPPTESVFDEKIPTKNLDAFVWKFEGLMRNLRLHRKDKIRMHKFVRECDDFNLTHRSIQELKRLVTSPSFKDISKFYLKKVKKNKTDLIGFLDESIDKQLLTFDDYYPFQTMALYHLKYFIKEVEMLTNYSENEPEPKFLNTPQQQNIKNQLQKEINDNSFFQINVVGSIEVDGKNYENIKQRNNDSIITTENWNERKLDFFNQRMINHKDTFTLNEKIELEIDMLNNCVFETDEHKILKKRYLDFLNGALNNKPHPKETEIKHPFSSETNFKLFKYLDEWFKPKAEKSKYTYIYNHFKDNDLEPILSQKVYFKFVGDFKNISIAQRLQGAPSNKIDAEINRLVSKFKNLNS
jgi:hypothetical protein